MSPLLLFAALYGVPEAPQDRSGAISKTFAAKICGTTDTLFVTGIQRAFPHSLDPLRTFELPISPPRSGRSNAIRRFRQNNCRLLVSRSCC